MLPNPESTADIDAVDYEYIESRGFHGHHAVGVFDAFVGSHREIWIGSDGSGLIRSTGGPASFFTDEGRARWEAAGSPKLTHGRASTCLRRAAYLGAAPDEPGSNAIPMGWRPRSVPVRR